MAETDAIRNVLVTGATGFVGRSVVRQLLARDLTPVCLVRSADKLFNQHPDVPRDRIVAVTGSLRDQAALHRAAEQSQAVVHLVGIIIQQRLRGQTFQRVHVEGTGHIVEAARYGGVRRFVHMSAIGTRPDAVSLYHRSKWQAEQVVRSSGLDWTVLRPGLIHGPHGDFMRLLKRLVCGLVPPVIPYFGTGLAKVQPVYVEDVARCAVESLFRPDTAGQTYPVGGPDVYTWIDLYRTARRLLPGARRWKPTASIPMPIARLLAPVLGTPLAVTELVFPSLGTFRFDTGQVAMSQEDGDCDQSIVERIFSMKMRSFEVELARYAESID